MIDECLQGLRERFGLVRSYKGAGGEDMKEEIGVTSFVSVYPRKSIDELFQAQYTVNDLVMRMAGDEEMLGEIAGGTLVVDGERITVSSESDPIYALLERIRRKKQPLDRIRGIFIRSDYIENGERLFKQVEVNTISCSFILLGASVNTMHQEISGTPSWEKEFKEAAGLPEKAPGAKTELLISEGPAKLLAFAREAQGQYERKYGTRGLFLIADTDSTPATKNYAEKRGILDLMTQNGIDAVFVSMEDLLVGYTTRNSRLFYEEKEVFMVYYRWLYNACQYTEAIVAMRTDFENTYCISVPDVETQIVGLKLFQPLLCKRSFLSKYVADPSVLERYFVSFLSVEEYQRSKKPGYVLKPLSEGGGNNFFGEEVDKELSRANLNTSYVLMEEIRGSTRRNKRIFKPLGDMVGEVGIFGYAIEVPPRTEALGSPFPPSNETAGYILRSKYSHDNETGVSAGFGSLDTLGLC
ncbi:glutathione synthase [Nematocida displodere]|uniref:Glutathione synthetase n=1 Tax=Nematocida displodere TaxID=1805483 RepID=A0A177EJ20_9MICR|nr:glutathione synthase [Nematocida displodere]